MYLLNALWTFCFQLTSYPPGLIDQTSSSFHNFLSHLPYHEQDLEAHSSCTNTPTSRGCWSNGFNITTDYEKYTPPGAIRDASSQSSLGDKPPLTSTDLAFITNGTFAAGDGYQKETMLINGTYPGPTIEGNWGDTFRITVHNELTNYNGTSIHWHGLRQWHTNWADGVFGVTQCPIPPGGSMTYEWNATQYGTSWYHSHFSLQYPDGIARPLVIHGPTSANYDVDLGPITITDWYHQSAFQIFQSELVNGPPAKADWKLMNGQWGLSKCVEGDSTCDPQKISFYEAVFEKGTKYKMRIINTSAQPHYTFWIDGHNFTVVATDFVPIEPYPSHVLNVAIGQRYDIIVGANADTSKGTDFWINMRDCTSNSEQDTPYAGVIRYDNYATAIPPFSYPDPGSYGCRDEPTESLIPKVKRAVPKITSFDSLRSLEASNYGVNEYPPPNSPNQTANIHVWNLADSSLYLDWEEPSLALVEAEEPFPTAYAPIFINGNDDDWVYFVIKGNYTTQPPYHYPIQAPHPIHLHGHDFVILAQSTETFNESTFDLSSLRTDNPTRRDVAMLPLNGFLIIAFQTDNPGVWLMHCHIAFHASAGLALQFVERYSEISDLIPEYVKEESEKRCVAWTDWYAKSPITAKQSDSGI